MKSQSRSIKPAQQERSSATMANDNTISSVSLPPVNNKHCSRPPKTSKASASSCTSKRSNESNSKLPAIVRESTEIASTSPDLSRALVQPIPVVDTISPLEKPAEAAAMDAQNVTQVTSSGASSIGELAAAASPVEVPTEPDYRPEDHNGNVTLVYEQYNEEFPIVNGSTTQENIDEVYCLSFVMPNCRIHLSSLPPAEKRKRECDNNFEGMFVEEKPPGVYQRLIKAGTYYVYVEQEAARLMRDQEIMRQRALTQSKSVSMAFLKDDGRVLESCSCIYGNPCVDEYGCKDWSNRYAVATKNGWKGF
jgi:hypothetical protein